MGGLAHLDLTKKIEVVKKKRERKNTFFLCPHLLPPFGQVLRSSEERFDVNHGEDQKASPASF